MNAIAFKIIFLLCVLGESYVNAQETQFLRLPALTDVSKVTWRDSAYRFPSFQKGKITYTKEFELDHEFDLNYNIYYERMDFINSLGDTLEITNSREIKAIQIADQWFFHDYKTGYYEVILKLPVALAIKDKFLLDHAGYKRVGYANLQITPPSMEVRGVVTDYDRFYTRRPSYFFIGQKNELHGATRASILKLFPEHRVEILGFLLEHRVDFESGEDLIKLLTYCNQFILDEDKLPEKNSEPVTIILKAQSNVPVDRGHAVYRFPEFLETKITWADQSNSFYRYKMNYNLFTGEMDVLTDKGDTAKFRKGLGAKILNLDGDIFLLSPVHGYLEVRMQGPIALALRNIFTLATDKKLLKNSGFDDQVNASLVSNGQPVATYDRLYELEKTYFFIDQNNQPHQASKLFILRLMPRDRDRILSFMNEKNTSFHNEQDLKDLLSLCNQLVVGTKGKPK